MKILLIVADYNDADYSKDVIKIKNSVFKKFRPMLDAINNFKPYVCRYRCGIIADHNWESPREDLGQKNLYETYPQFSKEYIDEFKEVFMSGLCNPEAEYNGGIFHTIVKVKNLVTGKLYVNYDRWEMQNRYDDKVKGFLNEEAEIKDEIDSYRRPSDGTPLIFIPYSEMTKEEYRLAMRLNCLWEKYQ